jgi:predicted RND superfamily exporter protein
MVYPDKTVKSEQSLLDFHRTLSAIEPRATGSLHLGIALSEEILGEAARAVFLVGTVILIILLVTFRNLWYALLCLGSLCLGVVLMLGIYPLFGRLNMINLLAVPLIIGIGIDYSIHIVHRFRNEPGIPAILQTTGKAILLSGLTTMFGFGSLALAGQFRGIATLGSLLFTGTAVCLAVSLVLLPALLTLIKPASNPQTRRNK